MSLNGYYENRPEKQDVQENVDLDYCCEQDDVLDTSRFVMGNGNGSDSEGSCEYCDYECDWVVPPAPVAAAVAECTTPPAIKTKAEQKLQRSHEEPHFDINDPLRYCLDTGLIGVEEYDKWKIVEQLSPVINIGRSRRAVDFGAGYNSDSDDDDDTISIDTATTSSVMRYGTGYMHAGNGIAYDPWFPNQDYKMGQGLWCVAFENGDPSSASISRLNAAFGLKILWGRFAERKGQGQCTLQEFWQCSALDIYEALQELVEIHARCSNPMSAGIVSKPIPGAQAFHTTPVEMLEHTFETIGRMSRCIAEDFNTESCVNYVEEFIRALYIELRHRGHAKGVLRKGF